jgi:hypothetical protein
VRDEAFAMQVVGSTHPLGHERIDGQRTQLGCRIAEQMFGLRVGQDDASFGVGHNHRIRRHLEQGLERRGMQCGAIAHAG